MTMEWKIGEIKQVNGEWYQCIKQPEDFIGEVCKICAFQGTENCDIDECSDSFRSDKQDVIFKKLEKVGEPYTHYCPSSRIIYFQRYKLFNKSYSHNTEYIMCDFNEEGIVSIEIKQNKEDMEEKNEVKGANVLSKEEWCIIEKAQEDWKRIFPDIPLMSSMSVDAFFPHIIKLGLLDKYKEHSNSEKIGKNLKPFDLEAAKLGKPVCTRDGRKARIICFDRKHCHQGHDYPIVALISEGCYDESLCSYTNDGLFAPGECYNTDLMMLPEKKEGWVNVYRDCDGANITKDDNIYSSKDAAIASAQIVDGDNYIATTKISWEE